MTNEPNFPKIDWQKTLETVKGTKGGEVQYVGRFQHRGGKVINNGCENLVVVNGLARWYDDYGRGDSGARTLWNVGMKEVRNEASPNTEGKKTEGTHWATRIKSIEAKLDQLLELWQPRDQKPGFLNGSPQDIPDSPNWAPSSTASMHG